MNRMWCQERCASSGVQASSTLQLPPSLSNCESADLAYWRMRAEAPSQDLGWGLLLPGPSLGSEDLGAQEVKQATTKKLVSRARLSWLPM